MRVESGFLVPVVWPLLSAVGGSICNRHGAGADPGVMETPTLKHQKMFPQTLQCKRITRFHTDLVCF